MKKLIITIIGLLGLFNLTSSNVLAAEYKYHGYVYEGEIIENVYYKNKDNTLKEAYVYEVTNSNRIIYSIEYDNDKEGAARDDYDDTFDYSEANLTKEQAALANLIGYYGYNYQDENYDHTDIKWYAVAQYLIWQTESENNLVDIVNQDGESIFASEIAEMEKLLEDHYMVPDFGSEKITAKAFDEVTLEDQNGVLKYFDTLEHFGLNYEVDGNKIIASSEENKSHTIYFTKKDKTYSHRPIFYVSDEYRNAMTVGYYEEITSSVKISFLTGTVTINKTGEQLVGYKNDKFVYEYRIADGVIYQLFATNDIYNNVGTLLYQKDELVSELVIGESSSFTNLYLSDYYFKEVYTPYAYHVSGTTYSVSLSLDTVSRTLTTKSSQQIVNVRFGVMRRTTKYGEGLSYTLVPLAGAEFGLYAGEDIYSVDDDTTPIVLKGTLLATTTSDSTGTVAFKTNMPEGTYYILRLNPDDDYTPSEDIREFTYKVNQAYSTQYVYLSNYYDTIKSNNITFIGSGNIILLDEDKNVIASGYITDEETVDLPYGNYYYQYEDNEEILFEINANSDEIIMLSISDIDDNEEDLPDTLDDKSDNKDNSNENTEDNQKESGYNSNDNENTNNGSSNNENNNESNETNSNENNNDNSSTDDNLNNEDDENNELNNNGAIDEEEKEEDNNLVETPPLTTWPTTSTDTNQENKNSEITMDVITPSIDVSDEDTDSSDEILEDKSEIDEELTDDENIIDEDDESNKESDNQDSDIIIDEEVTKEDKEIDEPFSDNDESNSLEEIDDNDNSTNDTNDTDDTDDVDDVDDTDNDLTENNTTITEEMDSKETADDEDNSIEDLIDNDESVDETKEESESQDSYETTDNTNEESISESTDTVSGNEVIDVTVPATDKNDLSIVICLFILLISSLSLIYVKEKA